MIKEEKEEEEVKKETNIQEIAEAREALRVKVLEKPVPKKEVAKMVKEVQ